MDTKSEFETAFDRFESQKSKCKFGQQGVCCRLCSNGPCKITASSPRGVCGATADAIVARNLLRSVAAGAACYLHVAESTASRLKSIAKGVSELKLRSPEALDKLAGILGVGGKTVQEKALNVADAVLADIYKPRSEKMELVNKLAIGKRIENWTKLGLMPGGAKSEVFDAIVKTSTNLSTDPVDQLLHCLRLGISTGIYGLGLTNLMNDAIMGMPQIKQAKSGFSVVDPDYINIAVNGHSHSVFAGLIGYLETAAAQQKAIDAGAKGIKLVGLTCVGQDMQLRDCACGKDVFAGQAGNNFTQEALLTTGAIDMVISEFNCIFSGIEPIIEKLAIKFVCLDDVSKQASAQHLDDIHGNEKALAADIVEMAVSQYKDRRPVVKIDIPKHGYDDVVTGVSEGSLKAFLGGSFKPIVDLIVAGKIKGVVGVLGCSNLAEGGHDITTAALTRELINRDILVLSAGCTTGGLQNCGFCSPAAAAWAGPGLSAVCRELGIPPVLNFGPCLAIGRIEMVVSEIAELLGVDIPQLPVAVSAPQWLEEQALADGCYGLALGLNVHLAKAPAVGGSAVVVNVLTRDIENLTGGKLIIEPDAAKAASLLAGIIEGKLAALLAG